MDKIFNSIKSAKKKRLLFGSKSLYSIKDPISESDLKTLETKYNFKFPVSILRTLIALGSCEIEDLRLHGPDWIYPFDELNGRIEGFITFASDINGDYFSFNPDDQNGLIYFCCHDPAGYCVVANSIEELLVKLIDNNFDIVEITANLELLEL